MKIICQRKLIGIWNKYSNIAENRDNAVNQEPMQQHKVDAPMPEPVLVDDHLIFILNS